MWLHLTAFARRCAPICAARLLLSYIGRLRLRLRVCVCPTWARTPPQCGRNKLTSKQLIVCAFVFALQHTLASVDFQLPKAAGERNVARAALEQISC